MRRLYLLRHAKSSWEQPNLEDHDRPLAPRGEQAGRVMAGVVAALDPPPALVLCSTAVRARQTWALVGDALPDVPVEIDPAVYTFEPLALRQRLALLDDALPAVLVVGHNPALELLAQDLAAGDESAAFRRLRRKFPTAAMVTLDLPLTHWRDLGRDLGHDLGQGGGRVADFTRPADVES